MCAEAVDEEPVRVQRQRPAPDEAEALQAVVAHEGRLVERDRGHRATARRTCAGRPGARTSRPTISRRQVGQDERHEPVDRLDPRAPLVRPGEVDEEPEPLVPAPLEERRRDAVRRPRRPPRRRVVAGSRRQARERAQALAVDGIDEHVLEVMAVVAEDPPDVVVGELVPELRQPRSQEERRRRRTAHADRLVVDRAEVEPALELRDDRDQAVLVGIAQRREVAVVALQMGERFGEEPVRARVDDPLHGLREHRRLDLRRRVRRPMERNPSGRAALQVVPLEPRDEVPFPEDDVRDQPVGLLDCEEPAQLGRRPLRIEARPDDRVEARVPEPLERVVAHARHGEAVEPAVQLAGLRVRREQVSCALVEARLGAGRRYPLTVGESAPGG